MLVIYPIIAVVTFAALLYSIKTDNRRLTYVFKPLTSLLFILTASTGGVAGAYDVWMLVGLILCMVGDVALIPKGRQWFMFGLVSFLLGHVMYSVAFNVLLSSLALNWLAAGFVLFALGVLAWLWPHLGKMRVPVIAYVLVISVMAWSAWSVFVNANLPATARLLIAVGATCFYFSDLFVARHRFIKEEFINRLVGLSLYYVGQFLLAFSVVAVNLT